MNPKLQVGDLVVPTLTSSWNPHYKGRLMRVIPKHTLEGRQDIVYVTPACHCADCRYYAEGSSQITSSFAGDLELIWRPV